MRTDTELLDGVEALVRQGACPGIINDDSGHWAVSETGMQNLNMEDDGPFDCQTTFFVEKSKWHPTLRDAIAAFLDESGAPSRDDE